MRGDDRQQGAMYSYISPEARVPHDHPLRVIRGLVDDVLRELSPRFEGLYARVGRPSIAPEQLLRAQLLQILYTIRSERQLMEQLDYNLLSRWFVGLNMDEPVWDPTVFTKNRSAGAAAAVALGRTLHAPPRLSGEPTQAQARRGDLRLAQDRRAAPQDAAPRRAAGGLDLHLCRRRLQSRADPEPDMPGDLTRNRPTTRRPSPRARRAHFPCSYAVTGVVIIPRPHAGHPRRFRGLCTRTPAVR